MPTRPANNTARAQSGNGAEKLFMRFAVIARLLCDPQNLRFIQEEQSAQVQRRRRW